MKYLYQIYILLFFSTYTFSQETPNKNQQLALKYMEAYGNWDFDKMKTFYAENITFEDPTATTAFQQSFKFIGKENVYQFFKGVFKNQFENDKPPYVHFSIEKHFTSGPFTIIHSTFECIIPSSWYQGNEQEKIFISIPFTTILKIENELIIQHTDYGNYTKYFEQINTQIKKK